MKRLATALLLAALAGPAFADPAAVVDRWYDALLKADRAALAALLADDAVIRLNDLGLEQDQAAFIASMDEWESAVQGATIRHRIENATGDTATVLACYDFPDNDILMRETFRIAGDEVAESTQDTVADNCDAY